MPALFRGGGCASDTSYTLPWSAPLGTCGASAQHRRWAACHWTPVATFLT